MDADLAGGLDLPALRGLVPAGIASVLSLDGDCDLLPLRSLSGHAMRLRTAAGAFVVRRPAGALIPNEAEATGLAHQLGLGPEVVHADPVAGLIVTRWIEGRAMTPEAFRARPELIAEAGALLRRWHGFAPRRGPRRDLGSVIREYEAALHGAGDGWQASARVEHAVAAVTAALARSRIEPVASHGDPLPSNFVATASGLRLLDWTYAGLADPAFDLAYLALEGRFGAAEQRTLLCGYGGGEVNGDRLAALKLPAAHLGTLWARVETARRPGRPELFAFAEAHRRAAERLAADPAILARAAALI